MSFIHGRCLKKVSHFSFVGFHREMVSVDFYYSCFSTFALTLLYRKRQWVHYFLRRLSCDAQMSTSCAAVSCLISHAKFNVPSCLRRANWVMYELICEWRSGRLFCFAAADIMTKTKTDALLCHPHDLRGNKSEAGGTHWSGRDINEIARAPHDITKGFLFFFFLELPYFCRYVFVFFSIL